MTPETRQERIDRWIAESAARIAQARESGEDAVIQAALDAYWELCREVRQMEQRSA